MLRAGNAWDPVRIKQLQVGDGAKAVFEPAIADFSDTPNVSVCWPYLWPKALYAQTRILLVASTWREPYGRVVIEGLLNGLPVIVSPEVNNVNWAHMVYQVCDGDNPLAWAKCIRSVCREGLDPERASAIEDFRASFTNSKATSTLVNEVFRAL